MEFKNCEQYVLAQLEEAQKQAAEYKIQLGSAEKELETYKKIIEILDFKLENATVSDTKVLHIGSVYSWEDEFEKLLDLLTVVGCIRPEKEKSDE